MDSWFVVVRQVVWFVVVVQSADCCAALLGQASENMADCCRMKLSTRTALKGGANRRAPGASINSSWNLECTIMRARMGGTDFII